MLAAAARLRRRDDFTAVLRTAARSSRGPLVVHVKMQPNGLGSAAPTRAGFVVGRSVGNAVIRNRTRRRLRHLVRARLGSLPVGSTVVVRALPGSAALTSAALGGFLDAALSRLVKVSSA